MAPFVLFLAGCAHFQTSRDLEAEARVPEHYALYMGEADLDPWWLHFNSEELNALVDEALSSGFTVQQAEARLRQAQAQAVQARALRFPSLDGTAGAAYRREEDPSFSSFGAQGITPAPGSTTGASEIETYSLGLLVPSYEIDLWGRVRAQASAVGLQALASREDFNTAAMTVSAQVAETWVRLIAQDRQLRLLREQLETNRTLVELLELRFRNGLANAIDVYQQEQALAEVEAAIPLVEAQAAVLQHQLNILLGRTPRAELRAVPETLPVPDPRPGIGLPATLLARRPDVRAAGLRLQAADERVAEARADRLPALRITAGAQYESNETDTLFDNWILNLSANLTAPLFDAGRRRAEVDRTRAVTDERLAGYREAVYRAVGEVEDALVREDKQIEHVAAVERQIDVARRALEEAQNRYRNGLSDYLPVLTQILAVQRLDRELISRKADQYIYRIALCRALGGSWMDPSAVEPPDAATQGEQDAAKENRS